MTDFERELESAMEGLATDARMSPDAKDRVLTRSRRRRVLLPLAATVTVLVLGGGVVAGANAVWDDDPPAVPASSPSGESFDNPGPYELGDDPSTSRIEVATGERDGWAWVLWAKSEGEGVLCTGTEFSGAGSGCGPRPNEHDINLGLSGGGEPEWLVDADLSYRVAAVEVRLEGKEPFRVPIFPDPDDFGVNFTLFFVPNGARGEVDALAEDGSVLETASLTELTDSMIDMEEDALEEEQVPPNGPNRCMDEKATIIGTQGDDTLEGTAGADVILALEGDDVITGLGERDVVCAGPGNDEIDTGDGDDEIWGGPGSDVMVAGSGFDTLAYWFAEGGVSVDLVAGSATGEGDDSLTGFEHLGGSKHDDILRGTDGDDQIQGLDGDDQVLGLGGDDIIYADAGNDEVDGGSGRDFVGFMFPEGPVTVNLAEGTSSGDGDDIISGIEIVHGSEFDDHLIGSDADESISGREGNDTIEGGGGNDELWGEFPRYTDADYRLGGFIEFTDDVIDGGPGEDSITGGPGDNTCTNGEQVEDC